MSGLISSNTPLTSRPFVANALKTIALHRFFQEGLG